jgi:hypothetical protein
MVSHKRILSIAVVLVFGVASAFAQTSSSASKTAAPKSKTSAPKAHVAEGSVVSATNDALTLRSGKKDMTFKIDSTTQKPSSMTPGNNVKVSYHDEGTQHIASSIELVAPKSNAAAAKSPAKK